MNIKRTIREEIDKELQWISDIPMFEPITDYFELKVGDRIGADGTHQNAILRNNVGTVIVHHKRETEFDVANNLFVHFDEPFEGGFDFRGWSDLSDKCSDNQCYYFDYIPKNKEIYQDDFNRRPLKAGIIEEIGSEDRVLKNKEDIVYSNNITLSREL